GHRLDLGAGAHRSWTGIDELDVDLARDLSLQWTVEQGNRAQNHLHGGLASHLPRHVSAGSPRRKHAHPRSDSVADGAAVYRRAGPLSFSSPSIALGCDVGFVGGAVAAQQLRLLDVQLFQPDRFGGGDHWNLLRRPPLGGDLQAVTEIGERLAEGTGQGGVLSVAEPREIELSSPRSLRAPGQRRRNSPFGAERLGLLGGADRIGRPGILQSRFQIISSIPTRRRPLCPPSPSWRADSQ